MSTLYGDNIFVESLELQYKHIIESSKLFTDFEIVTEAEGNFKDKILKAIKNAIQKVKDFFKWIKEKVLKFVNSVVDKVKKFNLKKKLDNVKSKLKKSNNESAILTEATYSELEDWLKTTKVNRYIQIDENAKFIKYISAKEYLTRGNIDIEKHDDRYLIVYSEGGKQDIDRYIEIRNVSIEEFVNNYESDINYLKRYINKIEDTKSILEKDMKDLEQSYKELSNITSIEDLKKAMSAESENKSIRSNIEYLNKGINGATKMINASTACIKHINGTVNQINIKLSTIGDDDDEFA